MQQLSERYFAYTVVVVYNSCRIQWLSYTVVIGYEMPALVYEPLD